MRFSVGDTIQVTGKAMTGNVGTVVSHDDERDKYLVRIDTFTQNYFRPDDLEPFEA